MLQEQFATLNVVCDTPMKFALTAVDECASSTVPAIVINGATGRVMLV